MSLDKHYTTVTNRWSLDSRHTTNNNIDDRLRAPVEETGYMPIPILNMILWRPPIAEAPL